jgi:hypothetical protein
MNKIFLKKMINFVLCLSFFTNVFSQNRSIDAIEIFKEYMFLDVRLSGQERVILRNKENFHLFSENTILKPDTLLSSFYQYLILSVDVFREENLVIINNFGLHPSIDREGEYNSTKKYVIAISKIDGQAYRLAGFRTSDFLTFLEEQWRMEKFGFRDQTVFKRRLVKRFIKDNFIDGLDMDCLFKASKYPYNPKRYPCAKRCTDTNPPVILHSHRN